MASDPEDAQSATSAITYQPSSSSSTSDSSSCGLEDLLEADFKIDFDDEVSSPGEQMMVNLFQLSERLIEVVQNYNEKGKKKRRHFYQNHEAGHARLVHDYFSEAPVYPDQIFRKEFRMRRELFLRIVNALEGHSEYFQQRDDVLKSKGLSPLQKCVVAIRQLANGVHTDHLDEYLPVGERTALNCLFKFCQYVVEIFGDQYLRKPNVADIQRLLEMHDKKHGFPGMLGSLACMHWEWKNCPRSWEIEFTRGLESPKIVIEAAVSQDLWICHAFFGVERLHSDINSLYELPLFSNVLQENVPECNFKVNDTQYTNGYYLTDAIYPELNSFVKPYSCTPLDPKRTFFTERMEAARKDVERAFAVLQSRWAIVRGPTRFSYRSRMKRIMLTCIILHNMIVEDEGDMVTNWSNDEEDDLVQPIQGSTQEFRDYLWRNCDLSANQVHRLLRVDLIEHIWHTRTTINE